jgi:hypothetical protein
MGYMISMNALIEDKWKKLPNSKENCSILGFHRKGMFPFIVFNDNSRNRNIFFNQVIVSSNFSFLPWVISWWNLMGGRECKFCHSLSEHWKKITKWDCASSQHGLSVYAVILCNPVHPSRKWAEYNDLRKIKRLFLSFCVRECYQILSMLRISD